MLITNQCGTSRIEMGGAEPSRKSTITHAPKYTIYPMYFHSIFQIAPTHTLFKLSFIERETLLIKGNAIGTKSTQPNFSHVCMQCSGTRVM